MKFVIYLLSQKTGNYNSQFKPQSINDFVCLLRGLGC